MAQGVLPGSRPAERSAVPDGWGARSRLPSADDRHTVRVGAAALLAGVAGTLIAPGHLVWAVLTVFTVLSGPAAAATSLTRSLGRVAGTAVGVAVGLVLDQVLSGTPTLLLVVAALGVGLGFWIQSRHYAVAMAAGTVAIAGLYRLLSPDPAPMLALRLVETAVGGASAIAVTLALWPVSRQAVRRTVDQEFRQRRRDLHAILDGMAPGTDPHAVDRDTLAAAVVRQEQAVDAWLSAGPRDRPTETEAADVLDRIAVPRRLI